MPDTAIAAEVHQAFDVHRHLAAKVTLNREVRYGRSELRYLGLSKVFDLRFRSHTGGFASLFRASLSNSVD